MKALIQLKHTTAVFLVAFGLACFGLSPVAQALLPSPTPDGGYLNGNTAEGQASLFSLTTGTFNTAVGQAALYKNMGGIQNTATGEVALYSNTTGNRNTAFGAQALQLNVSGGGNTAVGFGALQKNTVGFNTAVGYEALVNNTTGIDNTAVGDRALFTNTTTSENTAVGFEALQSNISGANTAMGYGALTHNTTGGSNTGIGRLALVSNTTGGKNTGIGQRALQSNIMDNQNTAVGADALGNATFSGSNNIALGQGAGANLTSGSNNLYIGDTGFSTESNTIRIGITPPSGTNYTSCYIGGSAIYIPGVGSAGGSNFTSTVKYNPFFNQLGVMASSQRFKKDIKPMGKSSEAIFSLKPVTFHYKNDSSNTPEFGLVAEDVVKVNPALIGVDKEGKPFSVQYDKINAMLLNEFLKEHKKVEEQQATIAELKSTVALQQKGMEILTAQLRDQGAQIQKVSAQLELSKPGPRAVLNNQ